MSRASPMRIVPRDIMWDSPIDYELDVAPRHEIPRNQHDREAVVIPVRVLGSTVTELAMDSDFGSLTRNTPPVLLERAAS